MSTQRGDDDDISPARGASELPSPMEMFDAQRRLIAWVMGALALIAATFLIAEWRPLFDGSGFGLVVELASCAAAIVVALTVTVTNVGYLRRRPWGLENRAVLALVAAVAGVGCCLDLIAFCYAALRV